MCRLSTTPHPRTEPHRTMTKPNACNATRMQARISVSSFSSSPQWQQGNEQALPPEAQRLRRLRAVTTQAQQRSHRLPPGPHSSPLTQPPDAQDGSQRKSDSSQPPARSCRRIIRCVAGTSGASGTETCQHQRFRIGQRCQNQRQPIRDSSR